MCLILFAYRLLPDYPLVLAANRDEYYSRPTAPAGFWEDHPDILAGRDLLAGGTWLGVSREGRFAAVTNYRDPSEAIDARASRGDLTRDFLLSQVDPESYLRRIHQQGSPMKGFNLLVGNGGDLYYYSNRQGIILRLSPGLYGLSNHLLNTPWPKVESGKSALEALLGGNDPPGTEQVMEVLADRTIPPDEALPDTGIGLERERVLSSRFIVSPGYGTRSSTVLLVDEDGRVRLTERTFVQGHLMPEDRSFDFLVSPPHS